MKREDRKRRDDPIKRTEKRKREDRERREDANNRTEKKEER